MKGSETMVPVKTKLTPPEPKFTPNGKIHPQSQIRQENYERVCKQIEPYEDLTLIKEKTVQGYIPRSDIIIASETDTEIVIQIPSFAGSKFFFQRTYKKL